MRALTAVPSAGPTLDSSVERYLASVRNRDPDIYTCAPRVHARLTHATSAEHGTLHLESGVRHAVTIVLGDDALASDLAAAINGVLARHAARPLLLEQLRASALLAAE